jgi:hypothetical protein
MGLDLEGIPWLVTGRVVLRRHGGGAPVWRRYCARAEGEAPFVGIGFVPSGVRVFDAQGGGVLVQPSDTDTTEAV